MKNGAKVVTPNLGTGIIIGKEYYFNENFRYIVELDEKDRWAFPSTKNPHFFPKELVEIKNDN